MKRSAYLIVALLVTTFTVSCGNDDPITTDPVVVDPTPDPNPEDSTRIDTVPEDTVPVDTVPVEFKVSVHYGNDGVNVDLPDALSSEVSYKVEGNNLVLVNANVEKELEVVLSGECEDGSFTYEGQYKCRIVLDGLSLTSKMGGAVDVQCGKRVALVLNEGTVNSLVDAVGGSQKACLYCKGHLEVEGAGSLSVTGNAKHAIATKEYFQMKKSVGSLTIVKAAADAVHAGQYFQMNGGTLTFDEQTLADGVQVETLTLDDDVTPDLAKEHNGEIIIKGGTIKGLVSHEDCKALKCDGLVTISGGTIDVTAKGNGSRGIQTDGSVVIGEEDSAVNIKIVASGGLCTKDECEDDPHRCMGMKIDGDLTVNAGTITVQNTGKKSRGIKVGGKYTKTGGTVNAVIA